jgi:hypothetical protein
MYGKRKLSCDRSKVSQYVKCDITIPNKNFAERFSHVLAKEQLSLEIEGIPEATAQMVLDKLLNLMQSNPGYNLRTGGRRFCKPTESQRTDEQQHHNYWVFSRLEIKKCHRRQRRNLRTRSQWNRY